MKCHCSSCEANGSLAEMEQGRHYSAGVFPFGSPRKKQRQTGRRAQWRFGGSSQIPASSKSKSARRDNETEIWEASQLLMAVGLPCSSRPPLPLRKEEGEVLSLIETEADEAQKQQEEDVLSLSLEFFIKFFQIL